MDPAEQRERFEALAHGLLRPLVLGGAVELARPFGAKLAQEFAKGQEITDTDLGSELDVARVRRARLLAPVDTVLPLGPGSWAMVAALNDLIQATNHELGGPLTRGRYRRLLSNVRALSERIPAPHDVWAALSRHATFARVLEIARTDSLVSWWTGSARFRGQPPPGRLLSWRKFRRVQVDETKVALGDMAAGVSGLLVDDFHDSLALWLTRTPLTDLATATRQAPRFSWSASTLSLVNTRPGRSLAYRAIVRQPSELAITVLARAATEIPETLAHARKLAESFASEVAAGFMLLAERT